MIIASSSLKIAILASYREWAGDLIKHHACVNEMPQLSSYCRKEPHCTNVGDETWWYPKIPKYNHGLRIGERISGHHYKVNLLQKLQ